LLQTTVFGYHYSDSPCSPVEPFPREDRRERLENRRLKRAYRFCWNPPCALGSKRKDCSCSPAASLVYPVVPPTDRYRGGCQCPAPGKCPGSPHFHSHNAERPKLFTQDSGWLRGKTKRQSFDGLRPALLTHVRWCERRAPFESWLSERVGLPGYRSELAE